MKKTIKTDSDLVRVAQQMDAHLDAVRGLLYDIEDCAHPYKEEFLRDLYDNQFGAYAWATHIVSHNLVYPEQYEIGDFGIRRKSKEEEGARS